MAENQPATGPEAWQFQAARYGLFSEVVLLIAQTADLQRLLTGAINKLKWVMDFERCTLALLNSDAETYQMQTLLETRRKVPRVTEETVALTQGITGDVIRSGTVRLITDLTAARSDLPAVVDPAVADGSLASLLSLPLRAYNRVLGAITFSTVRANGFTQEDLKIAQEFTTHLALAIDRWQQAQKLQQANDELARLASFPELNPNPVIEVDADCSLHYLNPAARRLFPDLEVAGPQHPLVADLLADLSSVVAALEHSSNHSWTDESKLGDIWYQRTLYLVTQNQHVRIYVSDITERKQAEEELSQTLAHLKTTQSQLIEAEKMAALGGLVAGVAHEINTPVGIGVTAASVLEQHTSTLHRTYKAGGMKRSDLEKYLDTASQSSEIILTNLHRAAELIQSFKQVAVDQSTEEKRVFPVKAYLEEVLRSLHPKLKRLHHRIAINAEDDLHLDSYPGAFSQIVTNLVMNSLTHAYEPDDHGQLVFDLTPKGDRLLFTYADDGRGIAPEHVSKIFEPFFTTKRSQGGSGLGLHIIYNLVTQKLGGTIRCESEKGVGTRFIINIPM